MRRLAVIAVVLVAVVLVAGCRGTGPMHADLSADRPAGATAHGARPLVVGVEAQVYPTGLLAGPRIEVALGEVDAFHARAAVHYADRGDAGEHDDEEGDGWGIGIGWRRWLEAYGTGWSLGARLDYWRLDLDWRDDGPPLREGNTDVDVLVPSLEGGYSWAIRGGRFDLTLGLGYELNVETDGEDVGEGAILLLGVSFSGG